MLVIEDLVENPVVLMKWAPTTHMLADILNEGNAHDHCLQVFPGRWQDAMHQTIKEGHQAVHGKHLGQQQRCHCKAQKILPSVNCFVQKLRSVIVLCARVKEKVDM